MWGKNYLVVCLIIFIYKKETHLGHIALEIRLKKYIYKIIGIFIFGDKNEIKAKNIDSFSFEDYLLLSRRSK
jgi:hypothetical protein